MLVYIAEIKKKNYALIRFTDWQLPKRSSFLHEGSK